MAIIITETEAATDGVTAEHHPERVAGTIHRCNHDKGFGFIRVPTSSNTPDTDFFAHITAFEDRLDFREGLIVDFIPGPRPKDKRKSPPAYCIRAISRQVAA